MKLLKNKAKITILSSIAFLLFVITFCITQGVNAISLQVPNIESFGPSPIERGALELKWDSNNSGENYVVEIHDFTNNTIQKINNNIHKYTFQNLEKNKSYSVAVRLCSISNNNYNCSEFSNTKTAVINSEPLSIDNQNINDESDVIMMGDTSSSSSNNRITNIGDVMLSNNSYAYNGNIQKPNVTVKSDNGTTLVKNKDYFLEYSNGSTSAGKYIISIKGIGDYNFQKSVSYDINKISDVNCFLTTPKVTYTGDVVVPSVEVRDNINKSKIVSEDQYTLSFPKISKAIGDYTVTINGKDNYSFNKQLSYQVVPGIPNISIMLENKAISIKYNKIDSAEGYQIGYKKYESDNWDIISTSNTSARLNNLDSNQKYSLKVRTYKTIGEKTYYGIWTATKYITTNK